VHDLLLQKSDGTFALVLWGERFAGGSDKITVNLGASYATVNVYDPTANPPHGAPAPAARAPAPTPGPPPLTLTNHPVVLEIKG
jgi:hypothetical protein